MNAYSYKNGSLYCENVKLEDIAKAEGTPVYVYSKSTMLGHYRRFAQALSPLPDTMICYAVKACSNLAILKIFADEGSGFDIVSAGELYRVIKAGGDPTRCTFAGVAKTAKEIRFALEHKIYCFNVESLAEATQINTVAADMGIIAPIALRINPNVDAKTHKYITTGTTENKFGIDIAQAEDVYDYISDHLTHIRLKGVQIHIGSQITQVTPFVEAVDKVVPFVEMLKRKHAIEFFSIGGGVGIVYQESLESASPEWWETVGKERSQLTIEEYVNALISRLFPLDLKIIVEPGRVLVGNAGALITQCVYEKKGVVKTFKIVDAGFNDLIRPALYEGHHQIIPLKEDTSGTTSIVDVVGPICETGDFFAQNRPVGCVEAGDYLALLSAGAYGFSMASNYNSRPTPPEVLVDGDNYRVIRTRQTWDDLIALESI